MALLQAYTIDLLKEVEAESGQSIGMHMTGGISCRLRAGTLGVAAIVLPPLPGDRHR